MDRKSLLMNLVAMAAADGSFADSEIEMILERAVAWGIEDPDLADMLTKVVESPEQSISVPATREECVELLEELIRMMAADGHLAVDEKALFASAAARMDITPRELDQLIGDVTREG